MFSLYLTGKWWVGMVAGVFSLVGMGTGMAALPAFADASGSPSLATTSGLSLRLECHKGTWAGGSFTWTASGAAVGSPVDFPACPNASGRRAIEVPPITSPGTGVATPDGFKITVAGKSASQVVTAACTFPVDLSTSKKVRRNLTLTCSADGSTKENQANMKIKVKTLDKKDDDRGNSQSNQSNNGRSQKEDEDKAKGKSEENKGKGKGQPRGWLSPFRPEMSA